MRLIAKIVAAVALPLAVTAGTALPGAAVVAVPNTLTANQIASRANADLKAAKSFHVSGTLTESGHHGSLNVTRGRNGCKGTYSFGTPVGFVQIGSTAWLEVDGQWIKTSASAGDQMLTFCNPSTIASLVNLRSALAKGPVTVISRQRVQELKEGNAATIYVTTTAKPEYVRFVIPGREQLNFSGINAPVTIAPPTAG
jgi:hypothetical protein